MVRTVRSLANQAINGNLILHSPQGSGQSGLFLPRLTMGSVPRGREAEQDRPNPNATQGQPDPGRLCREFPAPGMVPSSSLLAAPGPVQQRTPSKQDEGLSQMEEGWEYMRIKEGP